jgi:hypothetical protein
LIIYQYSFKNEMMTEIQSIFDRQYDNGGQFWSRIDGDIHAPFGYSTIDTLSVLGEIGLSIKDNETIQWAVDFVLSYQASDGSFKYSLTSSKLPCMTARIIAALMRLHVSEVKIEKSYKWLLDTQCKDGGWRCATVKLGKSPLTDASNPGTTLYVLDSFRFRDNTQQDIENLDKGVEFLLQHWDVRLPIGPCQFGIGSRFLLIEYPFLRYNIFYYVYVLSFYEKAKMDKRFLDAYKQLKSKIRNNKVIPENPHKAWNMLNFALKGQVSDKATIRWNEIETNLKNSDLC